MRTQAVVSTLHCLFFLLFLGKATRWQHGPVTKYFVHIAWLRIGSGSQLHIVAFISQQAISVRICVVLDLSGQLHILSRRAVPFAPRPNHLLTARATAIENSGEQQQRPPQQQAAACILRYSATATTNEPICLNRLQTILALGRGRFPGCFMVAEALWFDQWLQRKLQQQ